MNMIMKNFKFEIKYKDCECCIKYTNIKGTIQIFMLQQELPKKVWRKLKEVIW